MGCGCEKNKLNTVNLSASSSKPVIPVSNESTNNILKSTNSISFSTDKIKIINKQNVEDSSADENVTYHPYSPKGSLLRFTATKIVCENLAAAKELVATKNPPLALGEPAVVKYYDGDGNINLLFCIGTGPNEKDIMFNVTGDSETGEDMSAVLYRLSLLEGKMRTADENITKLQETNNLQDASINMILNEIAGFDNSIEWVTEW